MKKIKYKKPNSGRKGIRNLKGQSGKKKAKGKSTIAIDIQPTAEYTTE